MSSSIPTECPVCHKPCESNTSAQSLDKTIIQNIVPATPLGFRCLCAGSDHIVLFAPLASNSNDKGTFFAGSAASVTALTCWAAASASVSSLVIPDGLKDLTVVAKECNVKYLRPLTGDVISVAYLPQGEQIEKAQKELDGRGRAHFVVKAEGRKAVDIKDGDDKVCVVCEGTYVLLGMSTAQGKEK